MTTQAVLALLTAINLGVLAYQAVPYGQSAAAPSAVPDVIRARALEIVDQSGRVRASLAVLPQDPKVLWKGKPYPETVLLRLISEEGRPNVKLGASKIGAGLLISGESDPTYGQILAEGPETRVKLINKDGRERVIEPE